MNLQIQIPDYAPPPEKCHQAHLLFLQNSPRGTFIAKGTFIPKGLLISHFKSIYLQYKIRDIKKIDKILEVGLSLTVA